VALASAFAAGLFMVVMPLAFYFFDPIVLQPPLVLTQNQSAESTVFLLMIAVITPVAIALALLLTRRIDSGPNRDGLVPLTAVLVSMLGLGVLLIRLSTDLPWGDGRKAILVGGVIWTVLAMSLLWRAGGSKRWKVAAILSSRRRGLVTFAVFAAIAGALSFVRFGHIDLVVLLSGFVVVALVSLAYYRSSAVSLPSRWGITIDVVALILVILAVPDMLIMYPESTGDFWRAYSTSIVQFHQSLFLGPASQVIHGSTLLVDTVSQYGVGSIYAIAGFFKIAPISGFTLGFFDGVLSALIFGAGYGVLRMAGANRAIAAGAMVTAVITFAWGLTYPMGGLLQHGAIRFGLPMAVIVPVVAGARWPRSWKYLRWLALFTIGLSSIWALEAFLYVTFTAAGLIGFASLWQPRSSRLRWLIAKAAWVVTAWLAAHVLLALATLVASGSLPEWGLYLAYLRDFLGGDIGDLTYDISRWSPSILVFGVYVVSTAALVVLSVGNRAFTRSRPATFLALSGLTAYGTVLFSYYDNRSLDHVLPYVCLPALLVSATWLSLVLDRSVGISRHVRSASLAGGLGLAVLAVASVWPSAGHRGQDSLLAYVVPGGESLRGGLHRLWNPPPVTGGALSGQQLIDQYWPGRDKVAVLTLPDLDVEILDRAQRANQLEITDAKENSWVPGPLAPRIEAATARLGPGDRLLMDSTALTVFATLKAHPEADRRTLENSTGLKIVQIDALATLAESFSLKTVDRGEDGIYVIELEPDRGN
jgi:hypothetical protein